MIQVTKDSFFATVGKLNVHPHIEGSWNPKTGYRCTWQMIYPQPRKIVGESIGISEKEYFVTDEFYEKNSEKLKRIA